MLILVCLLGLAESGFVVLTYCYYSTLEHPLRRVFVSVDDPLILVDVTLSSHLDVGKPDILEVKSE